MRNYRQQQQLKEVDDRNMCSNNVWNFISTFPNERKKTFLVTSNGSSGSLCATSCVPKHQQHASYLWRIFIIMCVRTKKGLRRCRLLNVLSNIRWRWRSSETPQKLFPISNVCVSLSGATVVSWRVNNQEQLFVRWVKSFRCSPFVISYRHSMIFRNIF